MTNPLEIAIGLFDHSTTLARIMPTLRWLNRNPANQSDLCEAVQDPDADDALGTVYQTTPGASPDAVRKSVSRQIKLMVDLGLITPSDRGEILTLTKKGRSLLQAADNHSEERDQHQFVENLLKVYMTPQAHRLATGALFPENQERFSVLRDSFRVAPARLTFEEINGVDEDLLDDLMSALQDDQQIRVAYRPRRLERADAGAALRSYELNPLWIVERNGVLYLVANDVELAPRQPVLKHFAIHRMRSVELLDSPRQAAGVNVDEYLAGGAFLYPLAAEPITLEVLFRHDCWFSPEDYRLVPGQTVESRADGQLMVAPGVRDTVELRRWLYGMADYAIVLGPAPLRAEFARVAATMHAQYEPPA